MNFINYIDKLYYNFAHIQRNKKYYKFQNKIIDILKITA